MANNILSLNHKEAKTFFIKADSYFSGEFSGSIFTLQKYCITYIAYMKNIKIVLPLINLKIVKILILVYTQTRMVIMLGESFKSSTNLIIDLIYCITMVQSPVQRRRLSVAPERQKRPRLGVLLY